MINKFISVFTFYLVLASVAGYHALTWWAIRHERKRKEPTESGKIEQTS